MASARTTCRRPLRMSSWVMKCDRQTIPSPANASWRKVSPLDADSPGCMCRRSPSAWRRGQWLRLSVWVKPSNTWPLKSSTLLGVPYLARYSGLARMFKGLQPKNRACRVESARAPMRMAMSVLCSSKSMIKSLVLSSSRMSGYSCRNSPTQGTMACSMNGEAALMRKRPAGDCSRCDRRSSNSSIWSSTCLARSKKNRPSSVRSMRRVVRLINVVSSLLSSRDRVRLIADGVWPICSAAAEIEPHSITETNTCNSSDLAFTARPSGQDSC
ncbi:hypothetical protein D9M71_565200 [compost metagenome]